jgi:acetylornithine deacetylase/succinyl-diaminopimelate desuccinylase-like protein
MELSISSLKEWFQKNETTVQNDFFQFLRYQSISTDAAYKNECRKTAQWLSSYLDGIDFNAELLESSGHPVVFAEKHKDPSFPTVLIYHHYDVQPVDPIDLWDTDPFNPTLKEGKVFARGASDNKGQCFYSITALKALKELLKDLPVNIKLFIEGEEESGGGGTQEVLKNYQDKLKADHLCVIDFGIPGKNVPAISIGYRGILTLNLECKNASTDLHSGMHGGIALNPNRILTQFIAKLWDEKGKVTIPHFYDSITQISAEEKALVDFSFNEDEYRKDFGVGALCSEEGVSSPKEANGLFPTLEINGMWGGYTGEGFKTVIPAKAFAKISCRLVPDQDPNEIIKNLEQFMLQNTPKGAELKITWSHGAKAYRTAGNTRLVKAVRKSIEEVFEKEPCLSTLCGGAVPIVRDLMDASGAEPAMFGFALDTDDIHAPNEHFEWDCFKKGFMTVALVLWKISQEKKTSKED